MMMQPLDAPEERLDEPAETTAIPDFVSESFDLERVPINEFLEECDRISSEPPSESVLRNPYQAYKLGVRFFIRHQYPEAIIQFSNVLKVQPNNAEALIYRGRSFVYLKQGTRALSDFRLHVQLFPNDPTGYYYIGRAYNLTEEFQKAIESFSDALAFQPRSAKTLVRRGLAKHHLKRHEEALVDISAAAKIDPFYVKAYNGLGICNHGVQSIVAAETNYDIAIQLNRFYHKAYYNRGNLHLDHHRYAEAVQWFDKAIKIKADYTDAFFNRGTALHSMMRLSEAARDYRSTIALDPRDFDAHINLGSIELHHHRYEHALERFEMGYKLTKPKDVDARSTCTRWIGQILFLLGFVDEADVTFSRGRAEANPATDREIYVMDYFHALCRMNMGWTDQAVSIMEAARRHSRNGMTRSQRELVMVERYVIEGL